MLHPAAVNKLTFTYVPTSERRRIQQGKRALRSFLNTMGAWAEQSGSRVEGGVARCLV